MFLFRSRHVKSSRVILLETKLRTGTNSLIPIDASHTSHVDISATVRDASNNRLSSISTWTEKVTAKSRGEPVSLSNHITFRRATCPSTTWQRDVPYE